MRIPLSDCDLICSGFRLSVAGRPSLEVDGDLLWAIERRSLQPLEVSIEEQADGVLVTPLPVERQGAFMPQQVVFWRNEPVLIRHLPGVDDIDGALAWWLRQYGFAQIPAEAVEVVRHVWGSRLSLDRSRLRMTPGGAEHFLFPDGAASIYLGYLTLDWDALVFEARAGAD
ncbi:hypothetical protein [Pseudomonas schmalbachii]|uniref:DUF98 domain-containing protein n=1 Tax=Pseudomonas schmalbachii TaxID=2816993 RepID=A0ABS3TWN8_9PSED|nr:hypothetical protein [Pseudomonas schmalbachii]MBO3277050.1 hypothetical protein [Pseudomonas schmalbachii]